MRVRTSFAWYDLWVGAFYSRKDRTLFVCPLPTLLLEIRLGSHARLTRGTE